MDEELEHEDDEYGGRGCWCNPDMVIEINGRELWVHHGNGEELPPSWIIAESVVDLLLDR